MTELRTQPLPTLETEPRTNQFGMRPSGYSHEAGEFLRARGSDEPYAAPLWSRELTLPAYSSLGATERQAPTNDFGIRFEVPNVLGEMAPQQRAPSGFEQFIGSEIGQNVMVGLGAQPGVPQDAWNGIATTPMTVANFATWGREGTLALLSSIFLGGAYQQDREGGTFGQDTQYQGPTDLDFHQQLVKGVIEGNKLMGDILWGAFDGISGWRREEEAKYRGQQVRSVFATGNASRPLNPLEVGFWDNVWTSLGLTGTSAKYTYNEMSLAAGKKGVSVPQMMADFYDLPVSIITEIQRNPNMTDDQLFELVKDQPVSQDALANMLSEAGFQLALIAGTMGGTTKLLGAAAKLGSGGVSTFGTAIRGGSFAGGRLGGRVATESVSRAIGSSAGYATRKALQLNAWNTAAGWTIRGFEWGIKQYGVTVGDEGLVKMADRLMREMPLSMNPGLNLIDGFTFHPLRHLKQLRGADGQGRRITIGDEGSFSEAGTINLSTRRFELPRTSTGKPDVATLAAVRVAADEIRVRVAGRDEVLPKTHPMARLVEIVDALTVDDIYEALLKPLGWQRDWVFEAFESGKYPMDVADLKNFLLYGYAQTVRDRGFAPQMLAGATLRERSREFFRLEAPEVLDSLLTDLAGETGYLAQSVKGQWWSLKDINDSYMAGLKRRDVPYDPYVAFQSMRHWIGASKRLHEAYLNNSAIGDMVVTYARRLNGQYIRDTKASILMHYDKGAIVSQTDVLLFRHNAGPVEQVVKQLQRGKKKWERDEFVRVLDKLADEADRADASVKPKARLDPDAPPGYQPGDDFEVDARVLGIQPVHARIIEAAIEIQRKTGEPPTTLPPEGVLKVVSQDLGVAIDTLRADPKAAWTRVLDWYDRETTKMADAIRTRDALDSLRRDIDGASQDGRLDPVQATTAGEAIERINAEVLNPPQPRPIGAKGSPPEGTTWASEGARDRWTAATKRAQALENDITEHLADPRQQLRLAGDEASGLYAVRGADTGRMNDILALLRYYAANEGRVQLDEQARALLGNADIHPYRKVNALADAMWGDPKMQALAEGLKGTDENALMRELVGEVGELDEASLVKQVDGLTAQVADHLERRGAILEEVVSIAHDYTAVQGVLSSETRMVIDRARAAKVDPFRRIIPDEAVAADNDVRLRAQRITQSEARVADLQRQQDALESQLADMPENMGASEPLPPRAVADPGTMDTSASPMQANAPAGATSLPDDAGRVAGDTGNFGDPTITRGGRTLEFDESIGAYREPGAEAIWSRTEEEAAAMRGPEVPLESRPRATEGAYAEPRMAPPEGYEVQPGDYNTGATGVRFQTAAGWERMRQFREAPPEAPLTGAEGVIQQASNAGDRARELEAQAAAEARGKAANTSDEFARLKAEMDAARAAEDAAAPPRPTGYFKGDQFEYIGTSQELHGGTFYDVVMLEGVDKGKVKVVKQAPPEAPAAAAAAPPAVMPESVTAYIRNISSKPKKAYAQAEAEARLAGTEPPEPPEGLSVMASQGVRLQLDSLDWGQGSGMGPVRAAALAPEPKPGIYGNDVPADDPVAGTKTGTGTVPTRVRLMEADEVITSWDEGYPVDRLQPRDITSEDSKRLVNEIAANPLPEPLLRAESKLADGMPVVSKEGWAEVGNHRSRGLKLAYEEGNAEAYRAAVIEQAESWGFTREQAEAMQRPVLVREVPDEYVNAAYARAWNEATGMSSRTEAGSIGRNLDLATMADLTAKGSIDEVLASAQGATIIKRIMGEGTEAFAKKYIEDGVLNADGQTLVKTAIVARIVGDEKVASAIVATTSTERGSAPLLARGIVRSGGRLMELTQKVGPDSDLALGGLLSRAHYLLREAEAKPPRVRGGEQLAFGAADDVTDQALGRSALMQQIEEGTATPEEATFAAAIGDMSNTDEVAEFLRAYIDPIVGNADRAGTATMFEEAALGAGATRPQRLNLALAKLHEYRVSQALKKDAKEQGGELGMFATSVDDISVKEIPPIRSNDGVARSSFEGPDGTPATSASVPVIEDTPAALAPRFPAAADRGAVTDLEDIASVPEGKPVVFMTDNARLADTIRKAPELLQPADPAAAKAAGMGSRVNRLTLRVKNLRDTMLEMRERGRGNEFYQAIKRSYNTTGDLADLYVLRAWGRERWNTAGEFTGTFDATRALPGWMDTVADLKRLEAALARIEDVSGPTNLGPTDAAIIGGAARVVDPEFAARTGLGLDEAAIGRTVREAAETGAETLVRGEDEVHRTVAESVGNLPHSGATEGPPPITILGQSDPTRESVVARLEALKAQRLEAEAAVKAAKEAKAAAPAPELGLSPEAVELYGRYMADPYERATGSPPRPTTVGEAEEALKSLEYGFEGADRTMLASEREQLRVMLRDFLNEKYDEWNVPRQPMEVRSVRSPGSAATPTEHWYQLEDLAQSLMRKTFKTDEPLEGYHGVGYEFIPAPTKGADGAPLGTRLFYETTLTDELKAADDVIPGMGAELAGQRMMTWERRVEGVADHYAGLGLASTGIKRATHSLFDTAFGARSQKTINEQAVMSFSDDLLEMSAAERRRVVTDPHLMKLKEAERRLVLKIVRRWHEKMGEETDPLTNFRTFRRVGLLDPHRMETWTRELLSNDGSEAAKTLLARMDERAAAGVQNPIWSAWRKADNRVRGYYAGQDGGVAKFIESVYENDMVRRGSEIMSGLTTKYHIFRFLMDARWLAMEFLEAPILLLAREGPGALMETISLTRGKKTPELLFSAGPDSNFQSLMSKWAWWAAQNDSMYAGGTSRGASFNMRFRENAIFAQVQRAQQRGFVKELETLARNDPRMARIMREFNDSPGDYLRRLDRDWQLLMTRQRRNMDEGELRNILKGYLDDGTIAPDEVDEIVRNGTWTQNAALQQAVQHADDPVTRALLRRLEVLTSQAVDDASQLVFGQVDRSNVQRLMNHPLLYWPISYQIKATKWLGGLLLDRVGGMDTGAGGAVTLGMIWEAHRDALQNDPAYHRFVQENSELLFFASMFFPITPWDIGVSLSPWTRIGLSMATGGSDLTAYARNIFSVGPFYTWQDMVPGLVRERAQYDAGVTGDAARVLQRAFPSTRKLPPVAGPPRAEAPLPGAYLTGAP